MLAVLPWRWHYRFAARVLPTVIRLIQLYGVCLLGFGLVLAWALVAG